MDKRSLRSTAGGTSGTLSFTVLLSPPTLTSINPAFGSQGSTQPITLIGTNFFAPIAFTKALLPLLKKSDAGRIVNMSSILGSQALHADPKSQIYEFKTLSYDASKAALNSFTIHLAHELKDTKIKVNSAHPGWVKTDMGTDAAPMEIPEGGKTGVELALLGENGPTGGFFHLGKPLPW